MLIKFARCLSILSAIAGPTIIGASLCSAQEVTQFRGSSASGVASNLSIPHQWSPDSNIAWRCDLPGSGWSQPVIRGNQLFITAAVSDDDSLKPKDFAGGVRTPQSMGMGFMSKAPKVNVQWKLFCIDTASGSIVWDTAIHTGKPKYAVHPSNTYATETPVVTDNAVVAFFGATGSVAAFTLSGEPMWQREFGAQPTSNSFGTGSSLATDGERVFLQHFTQKTSDLYALDSATGETVWKANRDSNNTSWSTPLLWNNDVRSELVVSGGSQVDSFDPVTGEKLWTLSNVKAATACSVCGDSKRIYFGGSDPFSSGPLFGVSAGASGDISPSKKNATFTSCAWKADKSAPGMASPVSTGKHVYVAEKNIIRCYDAETGQRVFRERVPGLGMVAASPLIVGDDVLLVDEAGKSALISADGTFKVTGNGDIADTVWSTPAATDGSIYIRGVGGLYCIR
ncbi:MAG: PQQ-binding-like beta-propeller repeat protein [Aureliella sp.]